MTEDNWAQEYDQAAMEGLVDDPRFTGGDDGFGEIDFDAGGVDVEKIGSGDARQQVTKVGWYHMAIEAKARPLPYGNGINPDSGMDKKRRPDILLTFTVLKSVEKQDPQGFVHYHNLVLGGSGGGPPTDTERNKTLCVLVGLGILVKRDDKVIDPETGTTKINTRTLTDRLNAVGHCILHIQFGKGGEKKEKPGEFWDDEIGLIWGRGAFRADDPKVANVARNTDPKYAVKMATPPTGGPVNGNSPAKDGEPRKDANSDSRNQPVAANELEGLSI